MFLLVYAAGAVAVVPLSVPSAGDIERFLVVAVVGVATTVGCWRMERARKFIDATGVPTLAATWTFAGTLLLDPTLALTVVIAIYAAQWGAQRRLYTGRPHRFLYNAAMVMLAVRVAQPAHNPFVEAAVVLIVNMALVAAYLVLAGQAHAIRRMASVSGQAVEVATFVLGWATAALIEQHLVLGVLTAPVIVGIQYGALRRSVTRISSIDPITGVLTARAWHALAELSLASQRTAVVLHAIVTDLGTQTLPAIATSIRASVRPEDLIGRVDDGFLVFVGGAGEPLLGETLAHHIRHRLAVDHVAAQVGSAVTPDAGKPVDVHGLAVTAAAIAIVRTADTFA